MSAESKDSFSLVAVIPTKAKIFSSFLYFITKFNTSRMKKFDWKKAINTNILFLKVLGLWPKDDETYAFNLYSIYAGVCVTGLLFAHSFVQTFNIFFLLDDLDAFTSSIFVTLSCVGTVAKTYYLLRNMKSVKQLFIQISDKTFQPKNLNQEKLVEPSILFWQRFYLVFRITCFSTTFFWSAYPILDKWTTQHKLPFLAWYPFDYTISPFYEMTYVHQVVSIWYLVAASLNIDCLIAALNMFVGAQCDILADNLKNLGRNGKDINRSIITCVEHHRAILGFAEKSNKFFNWIVLIQFFTSAISVGFSMFQLTLVVPFSGQFYSFICYASAIIVEMFIYCWFGNEVEIKSRGIPYAVFECEWVGTPLPVQKNLLILTLRTQKPIKLSALNLFYLSLDTFKVILRTSWSYFTVLNQVNS